MSKTEAGATTPRTKERSVRRIALSQKLSRWDVKVSPYLYISPFFILFAITGLFPLLYTGYVSLHNWTLIGGEGDDILYGEAGENTLAGGQGHDTYNIANANDVIQEDADAGTDRVYTEVTYTLAANVEDLVLQGGFAINGTGNALANRLTGIDTCNPPRNSRKPETAISRARITRPAITWASPT